jgi:hypothetical protein
MTIEEQIRYWLSLDLRVRALDPENSGGTNYAVEI